ncbi:MAG TPA: helix-turn-helix domain-containing protein [Methylomirabilota bacterium]|nr:helix-turn-helix domain-containing protein [Methylomirabilota bacterium]
MANSVRLRALTRGERRVLLAKVTNRRLTVRLHRRYRLIAEMARGRSVTAVADRVGCNATMVYEWVHRFNESGFMTFEQPPNPQGRRPIITGPQIRELIDVALSSPTERGLPFSAWSVPKLAAYCRQRGLLPPITDEWVRRLLRREGLRARRIRTWKTSADPAFDRKKNASGSSTGGAHRGRR